MIATGALLMAAGEVELLGVDASVAYMRLVTPLMALGFGLGLVVPAMTAVLLGSVEPSRSRVASGTLNTARQTGSVIGVALFGSLAAGHGHLIGGLHLALAISVALTLAVAALTTAIANESAS